MNALRIKLDSLLRGAIAILMAGMVINVVWQVVSRFVLGQPSSFTDELARYSMIWLATLGAAYGSGQKAHLALDLISNSLQGQRRRVLEIFIQLVILVFALVVLVGGGGRLVWITLALGQTSAALQVKLGYVYLAVPVAGILIAYYAVMDLLVALRGGAVAEKTGGDMI